MHIITLAFLQLRRRLEGATGVAGVLDLVGHVVSRVDRVFQGCIVGWAKREAPRGISLRFLRVLRNHN